MNPLERLDRPGLFGLLLTSQALVVAPHLWRLPGDLAVVGILAFVLALRSRGSPERMPPRWLMLVFALGALAAVLYDFRTVAGKDAGVALLVVMSCLKLLELKSRRDALLLLDLGYFVIATNFFFSQSIPMALYLMGSFLVTSLSLVALNRLNGFAAPKALVGMSLRMTALAVPTMLLLFVLFPRLPGPLWRMPDNPGQATTGVSDVMAPGDINSLATSDNIAFRVRFDGPIPAPSARYWRGLVLADYDGLAWKQGFVPASVPPAPVGAGTPLRYTLALEQGRYRWLYALDWPIQGTDQASLHPGYQLLLERPLNDRLSYRMSSYPDARLDQPLSPLERRRYLALPRDDNTRARRWARDERERAGSDSAYLAATLAYIHQQPFFYTLNPPILGEAQIDDFWFNQRKGFCEHYASSLVYLMRAAGVPARVVVGYQGGERNPFGDYLIVRQSDAHAWTEIWLEGEGWRRVDPTAAIDRSRVESRLRQRFAGVDPDFDPAVFDTGKDKNLWAEVALYWDSVNSSWNNWVVDYNQERQGQFLTQLGLPEWKSSDLGYVLGGLIGLAALAGALMLLREQDRADTIARAVGRFERRLSRFGYQRAPEESPTQFWARIAGIHPEWREELLRMSQLYVALRYRNSSKPILLERELNRRIRNFRPQVSR